MFSHSVWGDADPLPSPNPAPFHHCSIHHPGAATHRASYLQFLHFKPNNIPFPQTVQVWDIQYLVENLQKKGREWFLQHEHSDVCQAMIYPLLYIEKCRGTSLKMPEHIPGSPFGLCRACYKGHQSGHQGGRPAASNLCPPDALYMVLKYHPPQTQHSASSLNQGYFSSTPSCKTGNKLEIGNLLKVGKVMANA